MSELAMETRTVERIRAQFPILGKPLPGGTPLVYLDNAASAQKPQCVIDKEIEVYTTYYANAYRGDYRFGVRIDEELEGAREKIRAFIGAESTDEVLFTSGSTMSINLVSNAWGRKFLSPGDEVLVTEMEHHGNLVPWQQIVHERGAKLRYLPITDDYRVDLSRLDEFLNERTKMVAITGMSNVLGTIPPIAEIAEAAHRVGALVLVDGAQSVPRLPTDVRDPAIDFLAFSGHKMYGPSGVGVLYGRRDLLEAMDPFLCGGHMISRVTWEKTDWAPLPAKYEAGTLNIAQAIALGAAVDWINETGLKAIRDHEDRLLEYALSVLPGVPGLKIYGPTAEHKGAIVSFTVDGAHPQDLANFLDRKGVAVRYGHHCTMPLHERLGVSATVRASFAPYNTQSEIDTLVDALHFARKRLRLD
ncbi:MAG: aminotransferase class V-fold PLP-dependent enzyme [Planctomycetaceae bacterium]